MRILIILLACFPFISISQSLTPITPKPDFDILAGGLLAETHADTCTRTRFSLNGNWFFRMDTAEVGLDENWFQAYSSIETWEQQPVPGTWDLYDTAYFDQQTVAWYARRFSLNNQADFYKLVFEGVFREARLWVNGQELGQNELPYLPFAFDLSSLIKPNESNWLVVRVDNRLHRQSLPCDTRFHAGKHGWFPYGGIIRPVYIESGDSSYLAQCIIQSQLNGQISATLYFEHPPQIGTRIELKIIAPDGSAVQKLDLSLQAHHSTYQFQTQIDAPLLWSPDSPENQYMLQIQLGDDLWGYEFAFRQLRKEGTTLRLNGQPIFLKGLNRHEDDLKKGPVYDASNMEADVKLMQEVQANFIRPGHYPNDVRTLQALEDAAFMIAEEIPVYQLDGKQMKDEHLKSLAAQALQRMLIRDYNRPCIVAWSVANELWFWPKSAASFVEDLSSLSKRMDSSRITMQARLSLPGTMEMLLPDRLGDKTEILGVNMYYGWYMGGVNGAKRQLKRMRRNHPKQVMIMSEFGAGAVYGNHKEGISRKEKNKAHSYSEEFQAEFIRAYLEHCEDLVFVQGVMPWVWMDFRMQWNPSTGDPHPVQLRNLKGMLSPDRQKKLSFEVLKAFYE